MKKVKHAPWILLRNFLLTVLVAAIVFITFFINMKNSWVYLLYAISALVIFISLVMIRKYFARAKIQEIVSYIDHTKKYNLATTIIILLALLFMRLSVDIVAMILVALGSLTFALAFLKTFMFGIKGALRR